jgi:hypothetical protein
MRESLFATLDSCCSEARSAGAAALGREPAKGTRLSTNSPCALLSQQLAPPSGSSSQRTIGSTSSVGPAHRRRPVAVRIYSPSGNHSLRATGTAAQLSNRGALEHAQVTARESPRTTKLYDRTKERLNEALTPDRRVAQRKRGVLVRVIRSRLIMATVLATAFSWCASAQTNNTPTTIVTVPQEWLQEHTHWTHLGTLFSMGGGLIAFLVSTAFVVMQMRDTQRWNVRKTSEEMLTSLLTGDFPRLMDRLVVDFGWDILSHTHYDSVVAKVDNAPGLLELEITLRNILRHLEVICINMKNRVIDEEICFDYLRSILTTFYINCDSFILKERQRRREEQVFRNTEVYARKWLQIIERTKSHVSYADIKREFTKAG